jgi:hypothetical protein
MRIFVPCEKSGAVRNELIKLGHDAVSCDTEESRSPGPHIRGNALDYINEGWDMMIGFPECRYLCNSGVHLLWSEPGRWGEMILAANFFLDLWNAPIDQICLENSVMHGYAMDIIGFGPSQTLQPYNFGEDASKRTAIYLKNLPKIEDTDYFPPRIVTFEGKEVKRWGNQTDSGQNNLPPSLDRSEKRGQTYPGIAKALAYQLTNVKQMRLFYS